MILVSHSNKIAQLQTELNGCCNTAIITNTVIGVADGEIIKRLLISSYHLLTVVARLDITGEIAIFVCRSYTNLHIG